MNLRGNHSGSFLLEITRKEDKMKRHLILLFVGVSLPFLLAAQQKNSVSITKRVLRIPEVTVVGKRPMKDIGVQRTRFDSIAMKENIALSMADVLTFNSSVFVKNYGRATLSTVAFRGTSPSHTQVTWNGMRINNPMLGMTDFSTIPSYFIDDASLLHGTSSVNETGGGLGGLVRLSTSPANHEGFGLQYVQGVGSFSTFDEFLRLTYGDKHWQSSTRVVYSSSPNDYKYRNRDKKENIYDEDKNIIGSYYPTERNRSGAYKDLHVLQEIYYNTGEGDKFGLNAWYINSNRELAMLSTDYGNDMDFENRQREQTFRGVLSWDRVREKWKVGVKGGYIHTWMAYDYKRDKGNGEMASMTRSRSKINTFYGSADGDYAPSEKWLFTAGVSVHQHLVESADKISSRRKVTRLLSGMTRDVSSFPVPFLRNGGLSIVLPPRLSFARICSVRNGPRLSRLSSSTGYCRKRQYRGESIHLPELPFSHAERPLFSAGR